MQQLQIFQTPVFMHRQTVALPPPPRGSQLPRICLSCSSKHKKHDRTIT